MCVCVWGEGLSDFMYCYVWGGGGGLPDFMYCYVCVCVEGGGGLTRLHVLLWVHIHITNCYQICVTKGVAKEVTKGVIEDMLPFETERYTFQ